jgi:hypothetical protein
VYDEENQFLHRRKEKEKWIGSARNGSSLQRNVKCSNYRGTEGGEEEAKKCSH